MLNLDKAIHELYNHMPGIAKDTLRMEEGCFITYYAEERLYLVYNTIGHEIYLVEADKPGQAIEKVLTDRLAYK